MPISPDKMKLYPGGSIRSPEWLAIRGRIRERAGDKCEECGVWNGAWIERNEDGTWFETLEGDTYSVKIVCTVAHLDGCLVDHSDENLKFLCQRCHNRLDAKSRQANAAITRHEKVGQDDLFGRIGNTTTKAPVAEMGDAADLGSVAATSCVSSVGRKRPGSSPGGGTNK